MPYYYLYCEEDENSTSHNVVKEIRVRVHDDNVIVVIILLLRVCMCVM